MNHEKCPYISYLQNVLKAPRPKIDPEDETHPLNRGRITHDEAEQYVRGNMPMTKGLKHFKDDFEFLAERHMEGEVILEEDWAYTTGWEFTGWMADDTWNRMKLDAMHRLDTHSARVIDYKTGKKYRNEIKHMQQGQLYMVGAFLKFPELETVQTEFWYLDLPNSNVTKKIYQRKNYLQYLQKFTERALDMTQTTDFKPKPSKHSCMWCDFGTNKGTGACEYSYED